MTTRRYDEDTDDEYDAAKDAAVVAGTWHYRQSGNHERLLRYPQPQRPRGGGSR